MADILEFPRAGLTHADLALLMHTYPNRVTPHRTDQGETYAVIGEDTFSPWIVVRSKGAQYMALDGTGLMLAIGPTVGAMIVAMR